MTPTDREKLYNLIHTFVFEGAEVSDMNLADHLIANGVTIPVRCKDCKWYNRKGGVAGQKTIICSYQPKDFFCAYGERRDNG